MAKGKVTQNEIWIMKGMYGDGMSPEEIAEEMGRKVATVNTYLDLEDEPVEKEEEVQATKKNKTMFINKTAAKKNKSVSIMTEAESSRSEITKGSYHKVKKGFQSSIHKISDEDGKN